MPKASSLAAEVKSELGWQAEMVKLSGGIFEVYHGGDLIFSKKKLGRFPAAGEVVGILKARLAAK